LNALRERNGRDQFVRGNGCSYVPLAAYSGVVHFVAKQYRRELG
jgi:hypothetical protein